MLDYEKFWVNYVANVPLPKGGDKSVVVIYSKWLLGIPLIVRVMVTDDAHGDARRYTTPSGVSFEASRAKVNLGRLVVLLTIISNSSGTRFFWELQLVECFYLNPNKHVRPNHNCPLRAIINHVPGEGFGPRDDYPC